MRLSFALFAAFFATVLACFGQNVISARSGTLHYTQGEVMIDGKVLDARPAMFPDLKVNSELTTIQGRAEILLTPGVFVRIGEDSAVRMLNKQLDDTRIELLKGSAVLENNNPNLGKEGFKVTVVSGKHELVIAKAGLFEILAGEVRVYSGEVTADNIVVKSEHRMRFETMLVEKFNIKSGDELYAWTKDRSTVLAAASMSSAQAVGRTYSMLAGTNSWYYNALLGTYSYLPQSGIWMSPFGMALYSADAFRRYYDPEYYWVGGGGARTNTTNTGVTLQSLTPPKSLTAGLQKITNSDQPQFGVHFRTEVPQPALNMGMPMNTGYNSASTSNSSSNTTTTTATYSAPAAQAVSAPAPMAAPAAAAAGARGR